MSTGLPYHGLTLVEAVAPGEDRALHIAAALVGRIFADLGARVISFVDIGGVDEAQRLFLGARKEMRHGDRAAVDAAVASADLAIVGAADEARLGARRPAILAVLSLLGGSEGGREAHGHGAFTVSALAGLLNMVGDPGRAPLKLAGHQEAHAFALAVFCGLSASLASAAAPPPRATVRASLMDAIVWLNWKAVPLDPHAPALPARSGSEGEWQVLRCADGHAALVYQEPDRPRLCAALGEPRLFSPRFATRPGRLAHGRELAAIVEERFMSLTRREIHALALAHRLPLGPVWSPAEALSDPHNLARDAFETLDRGARAPRLPVMWNGAPIAAGLIDAAPTERTVAS